MKTAIVIRHVPFEDLDRLAPLLAARGYEVRTLDAPVTDLDAIDPTAPDLLVVLGGPIGAYQEDLYPFLVAELHLLEQRLGADQPTLGICLGAQLMARALGAAVYPAAKELGWAPITLTVEGDGTPLRHLSRDIAVLHWHGDTFDLPAGARRLACTTHCANQAFAWGRRALGLQFHAEVAAAGLERWYVGHGLEIATTPGATVTALRRDAATYAPALQQPARRLFEGWLDEVER